MGSKALRKVINSFDRTRYVELTLIIGLYVLWQRGVNHRDVSIGDVYLSLEAEGPTGFIADLDLSTPDYSLLWKYCPDLAQEILDDQELEPGTGNCTVRQQFCITLGFRLNFY